MPRVLHSGVTEQRKASLQRLDEARSLRGEQPWRGAMDLAGYAMAEKHDVIWSKLIRHLPEGDWRQVACWVGASPEEVKAYESKTSPHRGSARMGP